MSLATTYGSAVQGVNATLITIEVNIGSGTKFYIVGLPDNAVKESEHRVLTAIDQMGYSVPRHKVVVNMAPADIRKEGSAYDLPIALGILGASGQLPTDLLARYIIMGELALDGSLRPIKGVLPMAIEARRLGFKGLVVPQANGVEAAIVDDIEVIAINNMKEAIGHLSGQKPQTPLQTDTRELFFYNLSKYEFDFSDVQGQESTKRALEIAAAGGHNVIMIGPPGAGKTMLAKRLPSILPPMTLHEALETTKIHSVAGRLNANSSLMTSRPYRAPHHTISDAALVGGGSIPQPGEISLAHNGVLFLDELPEFQRKALEVLRQPLEERQVTISRSKLSVDFPANFMLIASMNPCPCGFYNHPQQDCVCAPGVVQRYLNKISGPLMDRIDLHLEITPVSFDEMTQDQANENSKDIRERVINARAQQGRRFEEFPQIHSNGMMSSQLVKQLCQIDAGGKNLLRRAMERLGLSARAYDRILKVSRTIADLAECPNIQIEHIAEAIQYRSLDRDTWVSN